MRVSTASSPGHDGRANEDFVGATPGAVVLLDGAGVPGMEEVCRHGVRWYTEALGATLLRLLAASRSLSLADGLAESLEEVAGAHRLTCDLEDPRSPQASVAIARVQGDALDVLVLGDAFIVMEPLTGPPVVLTDAREVDVRRECLSLLDEVVVGTPEYAEALAQVVKDFRARRNVAGGYWIAKDDAAAARHAVTVRRRPHDARSVSLISNGVSRMVDGYHAATWASIVQDLGAVGPDGLIERLRHVERELAARARLAATPPDDATVAYCLLL